MYILIPQSTQRECLACLPPIEPGAGSRPNSFRFKTRRIMFLASRHLVLDRGDAVFLKDFSVLYIFWYRCPSRALGIISILIPVEFSSALGTIFAPPLRPAPP